MNQETTGGGAPVSSPANLVNTTEIKSTADNFEQRSSRMVSECHSLIVSNAISLSKADLMLSQTKDLVKGIKLIHDPICAATNTAHKLATSTRSKLTEPVEKCSTILKQKMGAFKVAHDRRIAAEQKVLEDKLQKEQEEAVRLQVAEMEKQKAPEEVIKAVKELATLPVSLPMGKPNDELRTRATFGTDYKITVINKALVPEAWKIVDEAGILRSVRSTKGQLKVPGIKVNEIPKVIGRASKG